MGNKQSIRDKHREAITAIFADKAVSNSVRELVNVLLDDTADIEAERDEALDDAEELRAEIESGESHLIDTLTHVRYYLIDILSVIPRDPKKMLRIVEDAL